MPITQSRMIALLQASQDYQQALDFAHTTAREQQQQVTAGNTTAEEALRVIVLNTNPAFVLSAPLQSAMVLQAEALHFRQNKRKNERSAQKMKENRLAISLGLPKPQRSTAPSSLIPQPPVMESLARAAAADPQYQKDFEDGEELQLPGTLGSKLVSDDEIDRLLKFAEDQEAATPARREDE